MPSFQIMKVFEDPHPKGIINERIIKLFSQALEKTTLTDYQKKSFIKILMYIGRKLASSWQQQEIYLSNEEHLRNEISLKNNYIIEYSMTLFDAFDLFLVQVKSTLDYLVKIPTPIYGESKWTIRTFKNNGDDVISAFSNNTPEEYKKRIEVLIQIIKVNQDWITDVVDARDKINHYIYVA